jgi:hypothetical protein
MTAPRRKTKAERQAWWASLSPQEQAAQVERWQARKAAKRSETTREAEARLDLANERGVFMAAVPDEDVAARLAAEDPRIGSDNLPGRGGTP